MNQLTSESQSKLKVFNQIYINPKVKDMKSLRFDPQFILKNIVYLYINYSKYDIFLKTVIQDTRSFKPKLLERTYFILEKY